MFYCSAIYLFGFFKIFGTPLLDELFIGILIFKSKFKIKFGIKPILLSGLLSYFLLMCFFGFFVEFNINAIRYFLLFFTLMVYVFSNHYGHFSVSPFVYFVFSVLTFLFPLFSFKFGVAWWQSFLVGTAYSSYLFFIGGVLVSLRDDKYSKYVFVMLVLQSILYDSRVMAIYVIIFTFIMVVRSPKLGIKYILMLSIGILFFSVISNFLPKEVSVNAINFDIFIAITNLMDSLFDNPSGRMLQILNMEFLLNQNDLGLFFGSGVTTHQHGLVGLGFASDTSGVIRPIGLPAIIYDFGILGFLILIIISVIGIFDHGFDIKKVSLEKLILIAVSLFSCFFVTNLIESVVFWLILIGASSKKPDVLRLAR